MTPSALRDKHRDISRYSVTVPQIDWSELIFAIRDATGWSDVTISKKVKTSYGTISGLKKERAANPSYLTGSKLLRMFLDLTDRDIPFEQ